MKRIATIFVVCTILEAIQSIRPGARWSLVGTSYAGLEWLDQTQTKPTAAEIITEIQSCTQNAAIRATLKQQARLDVRNSSLTQGQRLQALLILLDFDQ